MTIGHWCIFYQEISIEKQKCPIQAKISPKPPKIGKISLKKGTFLLKILIFPTEAPGAFGRIYTE